MDIKCNPMVTTEKIATEYTQEEMKNEFRHFDTKSQLKKKKIVAQVIGNNKDIKEIEKWQKQVLSLSAITLNVSGFKSSKTYWKNE